MSRPQAPWTPPHRDGVGPSAVAVPHGDWPSVLDFLTERLPKVAREDWRARLLAGEVFSQGGQPLSPDAPCPAGQRIWYWRQLPPELEIPFEPEILFQDDTLLVVDKPHFLPMTPKGRHVRQTLLVKLKQRTGIETLVPAHRLDRETAGVVLFTVRPEARHAYQSLFSARRVHKVYEAVAPWREGLPALHRSRLVEREGDAFMQMQEVAGEPNAETLIDVMRRFGDLDPLAHYRLQPLTGRKHQLRAHLCALGVPILGDRIYPLLQPEPAADAAPDFNAPLQLLAREIAFDDPLSGAPRRFVSRRRLQMLPDQELP